MAKAQWSINRTAVTSSLAADGTQSAAIPLLDNGTKVGTLSLSITADRHLLVNWTAEPGAVPLSGFEAWSND